MDSTAAGERPEALHSEQATSRRAAISLRTQFRAIPETSRYQVCRDRGPVTLLWVGMFDGCASFCGARPCRPQRVRSRIGLGKLYGIRRLRGRCAQDGRAPKFDGPHDACPATSLVPARSGSEIGGRKSSRTFALSGPLRPGTGRAPKLPPIEPREGQSTPQQVSDRRHWESYPP